ncbi:MAG TPA: hypothetical protein VLN58_09310, partial [Verrucomicrobiae bacterium]|nr:hypothetical protein [Verrucomicrobiae bacterium]
MRATSHIQFMLKTAFKQGLLFVLCLMLPHLAGAQAIQVIQTDIPPSMPDVARDFVQQIISRAGPLSAASVSFQSISVLPTDLQEGVQNAIFTALRNAGIRLENGNTATHVDITFSEDWQGYLWIASVLQNGNKKVVMKKVAKPPQTATARAPMLTIRKSTVWRQESPILDFFEDNHTLALLEPDQIAIYANDSGQWRSRYMLGITHAQPWPRDLRGRLVVNGSQLTAFLPGVRCNGSISSPSLD